MVTPNASTEGPAGGGVTGGGVTGGSCGTGGVPGADAASSGEHCWEEGAPPPQPAAKSGARIHGEITRCMFPRSVWADGSAPTTRLPLEERLSRIVLSPTQRATGFHPLKDRAACASVGAG